MWDQDAQPQALPGGDDAWAINNSGSIVGGRKVWSKDGVVRDLELPPDDSHSVEPCFFHEPVAEDITWRGEVVGTAMTPDGEYCSAVRWNAQGEPEFLEQPYLETYPGEFEFFESIGHAIEATGEVVGETPTYGIGGLWDRSGDFIPLRPPEGSDVTYAYDINIRGAIVGMSQGEGFVTGEYTFLPVVWR